MTTSPEIAAELKDWTLERRQEAGPVIEELEQAPGFVLVSDLADRVLKRKMEALLASGKPREAAEYARDLGEINGIRIVQAVIETVKAKAKEADDELRQRLAEAR
jgi:hypothetical protein